jgi:hypothetical protein
MPLARLFAVAFVFCAVPAFCQTEQVTAKSNQLNVSVSDSDKAPVPKAWQIVPFQLTDKGSDDKELTALAQDAVRKALAERDNDDEICYTIRSIRVERDTPDSDSTHPVGISTCQRASRYQVKSVQIEQVSPER